MGRPGKSGAQVATDPSTIGASEQCLKVTEYWRHYAAWSVSSRNYSSVIMSGKLFFYLGKSRGLLAAPSCFGYLWCCHLSCLTSDPVDFWMWFWTSIFEAYFKFLDPRSIAEYKDRQTFGPVYYFWIIHSVYSSRIDQPFTTHTI